MITILVAIALIGASSWLIVRKNTENNILDTIKTDTSPYFTSEYTYDGKTTYSPTVKTDATSALLGATSDYTITYLGGTPFNTSWNSGKYTQASEAINAGVHYFKIVETATGQVIANKHQVTVNKANVTSSIALTSVKTAGTNTAVADLKTLAAGFVGDTATWTITVTGVGNDGNLATPTTTYDIKESDFDTFSANVLDDGNKYTATYSVSSSVTTNGKYLNNYNFSGSLSYSISVLPTCYSTDSSGTKYYGTLDQGLGTANGVGNAAAATTLTAAKTITSGTYSFSSKTHFNHKITANATINSNVTFTIPYDETVTALYELLSTKPGIAFGKSDLELNAVTIAANVVLTNAGTINVPGVVTGANGGYLSSYTAGNHSRIYMDSDSTISNTGTINCYGFISEGLKADGTLDEGNGSKVLMDSGTIKTVFTVVENRGGSTFLGMAEPTGEDLMTGLSITNNDLSKAYVPELRAFPFNRFYIHSVTTSMTVSYNASVTGYVDLYANNQHNETTLDVIGNGSTSLLQLTNADTKISSDFDPVDLKHDLDIYGNMTLNPIGLFLTVQKSVSSIVAYINVSLNTAGTYFPISNHYDIELYPYANGSSSTVTLTSQDIKVLPGGSLTIHQGVTVNAGKIAIYADNTLLNAKSGGAVDAPKYTNNTPGEFILNGTLNVNTIGGNIKTSVAGATLNVTGSNTLVSEELVNRVKDGGSVTISVVVTSFTQKYNTCEFGQNYLTAQGMVQHYNGSALSNISTGVHTSLGTVWQGPSSKYVLNFEFYGTDTSGNNLSKLDYSMPSTTYQQSEPPALNDVDIEGYAFQGWYWDAACTDVIDTDALTGLIMYNKSTAADKSVTVYAKYKEVNENEVKINYNVDQSVVSDMNLIITTPAQVTVDKTQVTSYTLADLTGNNTVTTNMYYFDGWYSDSAYANKITTVNPSTDAVNGTVNVYGKWVIKPILNIEVKIASIENGNTPKFSMTLAGVSLVSDRDSAWSTQVYVTPGSSLVLVNGSNVSSVAATSSVNGTISDINAGYTVNAADTVTITITPTSCVAAGTEIMLADGTVKKVEDLLETDILLVYDHERGEFVACPILFIERDGWTYYDIINLKFSDGTVNRLIYEHALFDVTLGRYVYITADNCSDFIGHEFAKADGETITTVTLEEAYMTYEYTGCFSLVTYYHLNYFIDGMFSIPGGIDGIFNMFEYDENLKYDEEQMRKDIETYGLYTYEDFAEYIPEEVFNMFQTKYFKIAVGKGHITYEGILELIDIYLKRHGFI